MKRPDLDVWVLAGQSNMEGVGRLEGAMPPMDRVWAFSSAGHWELAQEPLHRLYESYTPVHLRLIQAGAPPAQRAMSLEDYRQVLVKASVHREAGAGLGLSFGKEMAEATSRCIGLIPAAHGGTCLEEWNEARKGEGGESLYGSMLKRIQRAGGNLKGLLWYQGESDACDKWADTYAARLDRWIAALRADVGRKDLPVLVVQLGRSTVFDLPRWDTIRDALYELPDRVPHTAVTTSIDLPLDDAIHISTGGLIRLGRRMARLAVAMAKKQKPPGPRVVRVERCPEETWPYHDAMRVVCEGVAGGWRPEDNIAGFEIYNADGMLPADNRVFSAMRDRKNPSAIIVRTNAPPKDGQFIGYGRGVNAFCNAVDEADMPLCSFRRSL